MSATTTAPALTEADTQKGPVVHLGRIMRGTEIETMCGLKTTLVVPYSDFSKSPCSCCIREKMSE